MLEDLAHDRSVLHVDELVADGECAYCGCTEDDACRLLTEDRERAGVQADPDCVAPCSWHVSPRPDGFACCSAADCVRVYLNDPSAP